MSISKEALRKILIEMIQKGIEAANEECGTSFALDVNSLVIKDIKTRINQ